MPTSQASQRRSQAWGLASEGAGNVALLVRDRKSGGVSCRKTDAKRLKRAVVICQRCGFANVVSLGCGSTPAMSVRPVSGIFPAGLRVGQGGVALGAVLPAMSGPANPTLSRPACGGG